MLRGCPHNNHHPKNVIYRFVCEHNSEGDTDRDRGDPHNHHQPKGDQYIFYEHTYYSKTYKLDHIQADYVKLLVKI